MSSTTHNNTENINIINNSNNNTRTNGTQACAACKYQRRKCASDCLLAPYFPHHLHHEFLNAHKLFGVSNITKIIRPLPQHQKDQAMVTIKYESNVRAVDNVGGTCRVIRNLQREIEYACAELELVLQQLAICKAAAAADTISLIADPQTQPQIAVGAASEEVTIHCGNMINNNVEYDEINTYNAVDEGTSPLCQQNVLHPKTEDDDNVVVQCDSMINTIPEDFYLQDLRNSVENNEDEDGEIGGYILEECDVNNDDNSIRNSVENNEDEDGEIGGYILEECDVNNDDNSNEMMPLQDMKAWGIQDEDALAYCLHDKEGFVSEYKDMGGDGFGFKYYNDEQQITHEHSDEAISKDNKVVVEEETASYISKDEKYIVREDFVPIEDAQSHDIQSSATLFTTA